MSDTGIPDSGHPSQHSSGMGSGMSGMGSGMSSGMSGRSTGTPGEVMSWDDVNISAVPAPTVRADLQGRIGEFESAFGSKKAGVAGGRVESGAVANIGKTALMRAAEAGDAESVQRLIDAGANVNATDMSGRTALMWAALGGHAGVVRLLLYAGADAHASHKNGVTAFMLAQARGHTNVVNILHAVTGEGDDPAQPVSPKLLSNAPVFSSRRRAIQFAAASALLFISAGALVYSLGVFERPQSTPARPIAQGSVQGSVDDVLRGVDINARDADGRTPLMLAAASGDADRVRRLIAVGAKLNDTDKQGQTALALAQKADHKDIVRMLRNAGARRTPPKPAAEKTPPRKPPQQQQKKQR